MKLGEGGEAFFVFETTDEIPASLQTSPLVSPAGSPTHQDENLPSELPEPDYLDLDKSSSTDCVDNLKPEPPLLSSDMHEPSDLGTIGNPILWFLQFLCAHFVCRGDHSFVTVSRRVESGQVAPCLVRRRTRETRSYKLRWCPFD